jgi:hypothetical protein
VRIIRHVGNYGEVYERNVGIDSDLGIPRGQRIMECGRHSVCSADPLVASSQFVGGYGYRDHSETPKHLVIRPLTQTTGGATSGSPEILPAGDRHRVHDRAQSHTL